MDTENYRPMLEKRPTLEKTPSQRKLKKGHVLQGVFRQIKQDTGKLWKSARSLTVEEREPAQQDNSPNSPKSDLKINEDKAAE